MAAEPHRPVMSVEEYLALERDSIDIRYEYIDGHISMMAGGTANHATIGINIISLLHSLLRGGPCRVYNSDLRVRLSATRYVYPDASVTCDARDRGRVDTVQQPSLIVEVLSSSTEAYNRGMKFSYYRACPTIEEYVMVDSQRQVFEVYRRASEKLWTLHVFGPDDQIELASINVSFPVAAIYEDVDLPDDTADSSSS